MLSIIFALLTSMGFAQEVTIFCSVNNSTPKEVECEPKWTPMNHYPHVLVRRLCMSYNPEQNSTEVEIKIKKRVLNQFIYSGAEMQIEVDESQVRCTAEFSATANF